MKTLSKLRKMKVEGEKIACLTAYEASQAYWGVEAGVDVLLVGDSLGMVVQGHENTLPVSLDDMVYHTQMVQRKNQPGLVCHRFAVYGGCRRVTRLGRGEPFDEGGFGQYGQGRRRQAGFVAGACLDRFGCAGLWALGAIAAIGATERVSSRWT